LGSLAVEDGEGVPAIVVIPGDRGDVPARELVHTAGPLGDEPERGRILAPPGVGGVKTEGNTRPSAASERPMPTASRGIWACVARSMRALTSSVPSGTTAPVDPLVFRRS